MDIDHLGRSLQVFIASSKLKRGYPRHNNSLNQSPSLVLFTKKAVYQQDIANVDSRINWFPNFAQFLGTIAQFGFMH